VLSLLLASSRLFNVYFVSKVLTTDDHRQAFHSHFSLAANRHLQQLISAQGRSQVSVLGGINYARGIATVHVTAAVLSYTLVYS